MYSITETPWLFIILGFLVFIIAYFVRQIKPGKGSNLLLLLPIVLILCGFGIDYLVVTDTESIDHLLKKAKNALIMQDIDQFANVLSDDYYGSIRMDKGKLIEYSKRILSKPLFKKISRKYSSLTIEGDRSEGIYRYALHLEDNSYFSNSPPIVFIKLRIVCVKENLSWKIIGSDIQEINNQPFSQSYID